ncbi:MAG: Glycosyl transferases group 1 [Treponematales bacterium]
MRKTKEITVFTAGDSADIKTWSNVPYFFTETLIARGIKVNRVDITINPALGKLYQKLTGWFFIKIFRNERADFTNSAPRFFLTRQIVKTAIRKYPSSDALVFVSFKDSSAGLSNKPCVLFHDWNLDYWFEYSLGRRPGFFEKIIVQREIQLIKRADLVVTLFPGVEQFMRTRYKTDNVVYLGHIINSFVPLPGDHSFADNKQDSRKLLFIGGRKYLPGAVTLIEALSVLRNKYPDMSAHIIGLEKNDLNMPVPENVFCYGYLDKSNPEDRKTYYDLLASASVFVNTTPLWGAFSASVESMYFYTPVVVTPYHEFVAAFGQSLSFGEYCETNSVESLVDRIDKIMASSDYGRLGKNAHDAVADWTWDRFSAKFLECLEKLPRGKT